MKVYIVYEYDYEDSQIHQVFATKELADKYKQDCIDAVPVPTQSFYFTKKSPEERQATIRRGIDMDYEIMEFEVQQ